MNMKEYLKDTVYCILYIYIYGMVWSMLYIYATTLAIV